MKTLIALLALGAATAVSAQSDIPPPQAVPDISGVEAWTYIKPNVDLAKYDRLLIRPTSVSDNPAANFGDISAEDQAKFASLVTDALTSELPMSFKTVQSGGARTLAIQVTILGAKKTTGGVATATRLLPIGLATNAFKSLEGKSGTLTGSLLVEVEFTDSSSGDLLAAAVRRRTPDALDVKATLSTTDTVAAVSRDLAKAIREKLISAGMPTSTNP